MDIPDCQKQFGEDGRYKVLRKLGKGTYGEVYECQDSYNNNQLVAVKKLISKCKQLIGVPATTVREIGILRTVNHPNIVSLLAMDMDPSSVYLVFEMMQTDLQHFMNKLPNYDPLPVSFIRSVMAQLLSSLDYLHGLRIFHRDLKPANILISFNNGAPYIKIADFGLSRTIHQPFRPYSSDILTMWYRAPELCLDPKESDYGIGVDIWSAGVIFLDMIFGTGKNRSGVLRGQDHFEMVSQYQEILGKEHFNGIMYGEENHVDKKVRQASEKMQQSNTNPDENWRRIFAGTNIRSEQWKALDTIGRRTLLWIALKSHIGDSGVDLLQKLLQFDPLKRICCKEALKHPFFNDI